MASFQLTAERPQVMAILNTTPDSFSDGGELYRESDIDLDRILHRVEQMIADGADIIDIGGESTRPGAKTVGAAEELNRVIPVLESIADRFDIALSVDTSTADVITAAAAAGASLINDVRALQREGALQAAAATQLPVCLMHMQGEPSSMQGRPEYMDVVKNVTEFLQQRIACCCNVGITKNKLLIDPGFGFGKTLAHNLALFRALPLFAAQGLPVLVGVSRKSMVGDILGVDGVSRDVSQRVTGSVALSLMAAQYGAAVLRVHDVKETVDALRMLTAVNSQ